MYEMHTRTRALIGESGLSALATKHVCVVGLGGVGGHAAEALVRCGIGKLTFIDGDVVDITNLNRQLVATVAGIGSFKAEIMRDRALSIRPSGDFVAITAFYTQDSGILPECDYVIDAIDRMRDKTALIMECFQRKIPIVSSMGAGNRLDPSQFRMMDIYQTSNDPLARSLRRQLRARGVEKLDVVCSSELPRESALISAPGSASFVPPAAGLLLGSHVVRKLIGDIS